MGKLFCSLLTFILLSAISFAQQNRCSTMQYKKLEEEKNTSVKEIRKNNTHKIKTFLEANPNYKVVQTVVIPVVVHVLYNTAEQNIPDSKILEQIDVLNNDYGRTNQDAASTPGGFPNISANTGIQFCLAKRDPSGKPTTGIERKFTTETAFTIGDDIKFNASGGANAWPADDYMNLWIGNFSGSLLGFATFPGSPAATDGVVAYYQTIGGPDHIGKSNAYNLGRTVTHEVGHWLGLYHIWGDDGGQCTGSDFINDTPNQAKENYGNPAYPHVSCNNEPDGDMFMNFLDYSDDFSMNAFSDGQSTEMNASIQTLRNTLLTSNGCIAPAPVSLDAAVGIQKLQKVICSNDFSVIAVLKNSGTTTVTSAKINYSVDDDVAQTRNWTGSLTAGTSDTIIFPSLTANEGMHNFTITCVLVNGVLDVNNTSNNVYVQEFNTTIFNTGLPFKEDFEAKHFPPESWTIKNNDNGTTWMRNALAANGGKACWWINGTETTADGTVDEFTLKPLDVSSVSESILAFDVAYANDATSVNEHLLQIFASADCGNTFSLLYSKGNSELATASGTHNLFIPSSSQWRKDTVSLKNFAGSTSLILKFVNTAGNNNDLYIDNIHVGSVYDIFPDADNINFTVLPNPSDGMLKFTLHLLKSSAATFRIFNSIGQKVFEREYLGADAKEEIDLRKLRSGVYSAHVITDGEKKAVKIVIH